MLNNINRRKEILNLVFKLGSVKVASLAQRFEVNEATIRRDLKHLAENYKIKLTYGGAYVDENKAPYPILENHLFNRRTKNYEDKQIIARKAASLVQDGETIALNAGSTAEYILDYLDNITRLNIITLSLHIAAKAATLPYATVYMPGGKLRNSSGTFYGAEAERFLQKFSVDKCFFGVAAVNLKKGVMHPVIEEISNYRTMLEISNERYLVADSSKYDCVSLATMADLDEFKAFIVDDHFSDVYREFAQLNNIEII